MKYVLLFLVSTSAFAVDYWEPHEKELALLEWKAAHSPQEKLARQFSKLENMDFVREFDECEIRGYEKPFTASAPQVECVSL